MDIKGVLTDENIKYLDTIKKDTENQKLIQNQKMGQEAFLKLLMAEMQNQDPMSPMDNKDTVAQMAQFSTVEQLQSLNSGIEKTNEKIETMALDIQNSIAKLNNNLVKGEEASNDELIKINETQEKLLEEIIKLNKANQAYETESTSGAENVSGSDVNDETISS